MEESDKFDADLKKPKIFKIRQAGDVQEVQLKHFKSMQNTEETEINMPSPLRRNSHGERLVTVDH